MKNIEKAEIIKAPVCEKHPKELHTHNDTRIDNYFWLNERENPKVLDYLNQENNYTENQLAPTEQLQEELFLEIKSKIKEEDQSVPYFYNGYYYISRFEKGSEYMIKSRKKGTLDAPEEILLDCNELAKGKSFFQLYDNEVSPNNELLAYSTDTVSRRKYDIHFKNLKSGELLKEVIPNTTGAITWANDNQTIFYTLQDEETLRSYRIMRHTIGTSPSEDVIVYEEKDEQFDTYVYKTKSEKYIVIGSSSTLTDEYLLLNADTPHGEFIPFNPRTKGVEYAIFHKDDQFYILTNLDAQNFKVMVCAENETSIKNWKEYIPHDEQILIENIDVFNDFMVISERKDGLAQLKVINLKTEDSFYIPFNDPTYFAETTTNIEFNTNKLRYNYNSLTTPSSIYEFDMQTKTQKLLKQTTIIGGHNPSDYISKRLIATARDGAQIPISLVYKKTTEITPNTPLLQYAYGSYGINVEPNFSISRLSLLDRGFVFAIAHIRGSQTLGRSWYEDGKFLKKKNTFFDFIDCSNYLIEEGYTSPDNLFAEGGSAGGLLMGAVINYNPELYKGVIAAVPFVDVVTTMLDASIPLTTGEYEEWGNPNDKVYYEYMKSYSPYDNVKAQNYPNLLVTTGLHDSQVQYWEPAKWVAKLRELKTNDNLLLLKTNMETGHSGASGRFEYLKETALDYAFLIHLANQKN
ncbi:MAG: S9 family peptidase [Flavobacteriales bacterium]|jgi:oligopeptidase B|nr:S9 family peptidase [Flavobacteriales bacterium]